MTAKMFKKTRLNCHTVTVGDKLHPHTEDEHLPFVTDSCTGVLQVNGTTFTAYGHVPHHTKTEMQID